MENYLICLKEKIFDLVFADINNLDTDFFINIKNITLMSNLLKENSEIRLIF